MVIDSKSLQKKVERYRKQLLPKPGKTEKDVMKAQKWIYNHFCNTNCTTRAMMNECHITAPDFTLRFKLATGKKPLEYIGFLRIELAKKILADLNFEKWGISTGEVAFLAGYKTFPAFSKAFKTSQGITPGDYLKKQA